MGASSPTYIDQILKPGDILPILDNLVVLNSAGHTPGHISFYIPELRVLFSGDSIFINKGILTPSSKSLTWDNEKAVAAFQTQLDLQPLYICGGHGMYIKP